MAQEKRLFKIGDLAAQAQVTVRTLRYYEELGLLYPAEVTAGGFRLYTESDLSRLLFIKRFKDLGFSLDDISKLLNETDIGENKEQRIAASYSLLEKQLEQIKNKITELEHSKNNIEVAMQSLNECKICSKTSCPPSCSNQKALL